MGGRGAWSSTADELVDMRNGFFMPEKWDKTHPAPLVPSTLKEALGNKGGIMGVNRALKGANPFYSSDYDEFSKNCQRVVIAYELRRRGYKVTAQPTFEGDILPSRAGRNNGFWQGAFRGAKSEYIGASTIEKARSNLHDKMKSYGSGSRAIVSLTWKNSNQGHVFNAENIRGNIVYVDAQTGVKYRPKTILNGTKPSSIRIIRTDNLRISDRAKKSVWTRGV